MIYYAKKLWLLLTDTQGSGKKKAFSKLMKPQQIPGKKNQLILDVEYPRI